MERFYLGTDMPSWLGRVDVPLFVSHRRLRRQRRFRSASAPWALDSGAFTELSKPPHRWTTSTGEYADAVERYAAEIGALEWASPQDSMCEPFVLDAIGDATGHRPTVEEHQHATVANLLELRATAPHLPWVPVVQGWTVDDYLACVELYADAGIDLRDEPLVGVGSVCRRQHTIDAERIFTVLAHHGLRLHAYGLKMQGLARFAGILTSADSMAWSYNARRRGTAGGEGRLLASCTHRGATCAHCPDYALDWRARTIAASRVPQQSAMPW